MIPIDIRNQKNLTEKDILSLNFINASSPYRFRKYYRSGLRSHIFEVLLAKDLEMEQNGIQEDGIRVFPRACPLKIFRIFRNRFKQIDDIFNEIKKYNLLLSMLGAEFIARSEEFIVEYTDARNNPILLCGLQEYIQGEILDPWKIFNTRYLNQLFDLIPGTEKSEAEFVRIAQKSIRTFIQKIRKMIIQHQYIPDLAGIGNLLITPDAQLKLVDINNIVPVIFNDLIPLDDKGYPSCDVSIQVLFMLETRLFNRKPDPDDPLFQFFLTNDRQQRVKSLEKKFYDTLPS